MSWGATPSPGRGSSTTMGVHRAGPAPQGRDRSAAISRPYDRQVILHLKVNDPGDAVIAESSKSLQQLASRKGIPSEIVVGCNAGGDGPQRFTQATQGAVSAALSKLTVNSRLYLNAHGDWRSRQLADWKPRDLAYALARAGLREVKIISILGCSMARALGSADTAMMGNTAHTFGGGLHWWLEVDQHIKTVVYARLYNLGIISPASATATSAVGQKVTFDNEDEGSAWESKRIGSKVQWYWKEKVQVRAIL